MFIYITAKPPGTVLANAAVRSWHQSNRKLYIYLGFLCRNYMSIFTKLVPLVFGLLSVLTVSAARFTVLVGAGGENKYEPATTKIRVGDEVEFKYVSGVHPTMSDSNPALWTLFVPSNQLQSMIIPASKFTTAGAYPYHCTVHEGMAGTIIVESALATTPAALTGALTIFPNPSRGQVNVTLTERGRGDYKLRLRNIIGQEVRTFALRPELMGAAGLPLNLSDLPAGLYFYSLLIDNKAVLTKRLTLQ